MKKYENPSRFPEEIDPLMFFQDIDIPHKEAHDRFNELFSKGKYTEAIEYINSVDGVDGYFAGFYNFLVQRVYHLQRGMKEADNKFIYSTVTPDKFYPFIHNNSIWFNYDKKTKQTAPESRDAEVNEQIVSDMVIRHVDSNTPNGSMYDIVTTVTSDRKWYQDIYITDGVQLKDEFESTVELSPTWYTDRTYWRGEELVAEYICDDLPKRTLKTKSGFTLKTKQGKALTTKILEEFDREPPLYYWTSKSDGSFITTKAGKKIRLYPYEETVSIVYIYSAKGKLLKKITVPVKEPAIKTDPQKFPEDDKKFVHTKFRILANLPTLLWHRLSFVTDYTDVLVNGNTNIKEYLDEYKARVDTNIPRLLAPAPRLGIPRNSVNSVEELIIAYRDGMELLTDTIKDITGEGGHLDEESLPKVVALFILNSMYSPIIDAALRIADRKGVTGSRAYTMDNAIRILSELVNIPLYVKGPNGTKLLLKTRDGKSIKLRYSAEV